jgi:hypothetical protein
VAQLCVGGRERDGGSELFSSIAARSRTGTEVSFSSRNEALADGVSGKGNLRPQDAAGSTREKFTAADASVEQFSS